MNKKNITITLLFIFLVMVLTSCDVSKVTNPEYQTLKEEVDAIVESHVEVGMIVGILDGERNEIVYTYGKKSLGSNTKPDANTVFDIGSTTKTFTATLLAFKYLDGTCTDCTASNYLPDNVSLPTYDGTEITIGDLATHISGLPRTPHEEGQSYPIPSGFDPLNPYWVYTTEDVYDYLTNYCVLEFKPGEGYSYSNTGYGLLGHIIGLVDGTSYETVLQRDIFDELNMTRSSLFLTPEQMTNYSLGYTSQMEQVPYYTAHDIFQGCGFAKSCLNDLLIYLKANMGLYDTQLYPAMELAHQPIVHGSPNDVGIAWYILELDDGQQIIWTGGDTQGHSTYLAFNNATKTGVILLSNCCMHGEQITLGEEIMQAIPKY